MFFRSQTEVTKNISFFKKYFFCVFRKTLFVLRGNCKNIKQKPFVFALQFVVLAVVIAAANAGLLPAAAPAIAYSAAPAVSSISYSSPVVSYGAPLAAPAITSQSSNILRSFGNLGQVSTYSKTIDTPYSSVRKADIRVSNPGLRTYAAPLAVAAPVAQTYAAPVAHAYAAPAAIGVAYSAAPAVSHVTYTGLGVNYGW